MKKEGAHMGHYVLVNMSEPLYDLITNQTSAKIIKRQVIVDMGMLASLCTTVAITSLAGSWKR